MTIYKNTTEIDNFMCGNSTVDSIYLGNTEVWSSNKMIDLGTAQSFDIGTILSSKGITNIDVSTLTVDNFFAVTMNNASSSCNLGWESNTDSGGVAYSAESLVKSYTASSGILTFYVSSKSRDRYFGWDGSGTASVHAYLVLKPNKLTSLGSGKTFNIQTLLPTVDYTKLTADNFLIQSASGSSGDHGSGTAGVTGTQWATAGLNKSYDSSTGVLTCGFGKKSCSPNNSTNYGNTTVYYIKDLSKAN